jgi:hypothetical protein
MWAQNATLQVALSGRLSVYPVSGSAPRFGYIFTCSGSAQCRHQLGPLMGTGNPGSTTAFVVFATGFSNSDGYRTGCAIRRTAPPLRGQAERYNETRPLAVISQENARAACPNCSSDLGPSGNEKRAPYDACPFCGVQLIPIWWQRILVVATALVLSFTVPACLSLIGTTLLFVAMLCTFPALLLAHILVFMTIQPKYVRKGQAVTTLFRR